MESRRRAWSEASVAFRMHAVDWTSNQVISVLGFSLTLHFKLACIQFYICIYVFYKPLNPSSCVVLSNSDCLHESFVNSLNQITTTTTTTTTTTALIACMNFR